MGSRTLSRDSGLDLSPATIRNVMADLEEMGLVAAPHTSAGRVPTAKGYRLFVDTLVRYRQPRGTELRRLQSHLQKNVDDPDSLISSVSNMLSDITSLAGVVTVPRGQQAILRQIEFLPLSDHRVLVILVFNDREVQNRILHLDRDFSESELIQAANFINEKYAGMDMLQVREQIVSDLDELRDSMNQAMQDIIAVAHSAFAGATEGPRVKGLHVMEAREGAGIPGAYGKMRVGGQVIWAARFREAKTTRSTGGKGGPKVSDFSYSVSFAVALNLAIWNLNR